MLLHYMQILVLTLCYVYQFCWVIIHFTTVCELSVAVVVVAAVTKSDSLAENQEKLQKLTDIISFLEN